MAFPPSIVDAFRTSTGRDPQGVWSAPGRVNLIGEHTDYNEGVVLPFALSLRAAVAGTRRPDGMLSIGSRQRPGPLSFQSIETLTPGAVQGWSAYVAGVVWSLRAAGHRLGGVDLVVDSAVPIGSGLSSSAALECATALALDDLFELDIERTQLARHAQHAENAFVGVPCGLMDQMVSMVATRGHALLFDTRTGSLEHIGFDPVAAGLQLLVIDTHARHAHAGGAYAELRQTCAAAATRLGVRALRDVPEHGLEKAIRLLVDHPGLAQRVRHVVTENARTWRAADLLRAGRVADIGPLLTASHQSLRDDFGVSSVELDTAVDAALEAGALGARMTGGGFGGCAIALVAAARTSIVADAVAVAALAAGLPVPSVVTAAACAGARMDASGPGPL